MSVFKKLGDYCGKRAKSELKKSVCGKGKTITKAGADYQVRKSLYDGMWGKKK